MREIGSWGRYQDIDGDGIPYRTRPADGTPAYFTRGSGHNEKGAYSERPDDYVKNLDRLARKFETARSRMPAPVLDERPGAAIGILAFGTSHWAIVESRDQLEREQGIETSYLRVRSYPFTAAVDDFIDRHDRIYVVEQNRDGQLRALLRADLEPHRSAKLRSIRHYNGLPIDARSVTDDLLVQEGLRRAPTENPAGRDDEEGRLGAVREKKVVST